MIVSLDTNNPRSLRGVALAAQAASWLRIRLADGRTGYGMPSTADPLHYWLVSTDSCSCPDHRFRQVACRHIFAVRLFEVLSGVPVSPPSRQPESSERLWARFEGE